MDINLSGALTGVEAAEKLGELMVVPVVFLTAYTASEASPRYRPKPGALRVGKPLLRAELRERMLQALGS